jgi:hypothetical protein
MIVNKIISLWCCSFSIMSSPRQPPGVSRGWPSRPCCPCVHMHTLAAMLSGVDPNEFPILQVIITGLACPPVPFAVLCSAAFSMPGHLPKRSPSWLMLSPRFFPDTRSLHHLLSLLNLQTLGAVSGSCQHHLSGRSPRLRLVSSHTPPCSSDDASSLYMIPV